jgi:hypothetical protein
MCDCRQGTRYISWVDEDVSKGTAKKEIEPKVPSTKKYQGSE